MANHLIHMVEEVMKTLKEVELDWARSSEQVDLARQSGGAYPLFRMLGYTEQLLLIKGLTRSIHRVFIQTNDSGGYEKLGWVLRADVSCCMICSADFPTESSAFAVFDWSSTSSANLHKVNCHACGNVVCSKCVAAAVVSELRNEGAVPVCSQCFFGQDEISIVPSAPLPPSYKLHRRLLEQSSMKTQPNGSTASVGSGGGGGVDGVGGGNGNVFVGEDGEMPRVWKYGPVVLHPVTPVFSITAFTKNKNRSSRHTTHTATSAHTNQHKHHTTPTSPTSTSPCTTFYINFCSSVHVPLNLHADCALPNAPLTKKAQELMLMVSERGACSSDSTVYVYDVTLHPTVFAKCAEDSSGLLKERVCVESLKSIVRLGLEHEFTVFTYNTAGTSSTVSSVYNHRLYTSAERLQMAQDIEHYHRSDNKVHVHHTTATASTSTADAGAVTPDPSKAITPTSATTALYSPTPSISAFFHMEQIHIQHAHLTRPAGNHAKRWQKYAEITQLADGTVLIPSNKRVRKTNGAVEVPVPVLVVCGSGDVVSYSINIAPNNGFVINTTHVVNGAFENVLVHVLHSPYVDHVAYSALCTTLDDTDPLIFVSKRAYKVRGVVSTSSISASSNGSGVCMAYNVVVGSSYINGVQPDLTGRRIVAAERIDKILRRVNASFDEHLNLHKYTLTGVDARPITAPAAPTLYVYKRLALVGTHDVHSVHAHGTPSHPTIHAKNSGTPTSAGKHVTLALGATSKTSPSSITRNTNTNTNTNTTRHVRQTSNNSVLSDLSVSCASSVDEQYNSTPTIHNSNHSSPLSPGSGSVVSGVSGAGKEKKLRHFFPSNDAMGPTTGTNTGIADMDNSNNAANTAQRPSPVDTSAHRRLSGSGSVSSNGSTEYHSAHHTGTVPSVMLQGERTPLGRAKSTRVPISPTVAEYNATVVNTTTANNSGNITGRPPSSRGKSLNLLAFSLRSGSGEIVYSSNNNSSSASPRGTPGGSPVTTPRSTPPPSPRTSLTSENRNILAKFIPPPLLKSLSQGSTGNPSSEATSNEPVKRANLATIPGDQMVTLEMLHYDVHSSVNRAVAEGINRQSKAEPKLLFGWQIRVHEHSENTSGGVYVVTCVQRKGVAGKHEFRLTSVGGDIWVKLVRGGEGEGLNFTAIRKVMIADE